MIRGYKGFDKDLKCRDFQYEVGKEYECKNAVACVEGFHFCKNPFDVFKFYRPSVENGLNRFCKVEGSGKFDLSKEKKICCSKIKIVKEISLQELIEEQIKFVDENHKNKKTIVCKTDVRSTAANIVDGSVAENTGNYSVSANTGDFSVATNTGCDSVATNTGDNSATTNTGISSVAANTGSYSIATCTGSFSQSANNGSYSVSVNTGVKSLATNMGYASIAKSEGNYSTSVNVGAKSSASVEGEDSIAIVTGKDCKAKGALGCWIVLTERGKQDGICYPIKEVKAFKVDGEKIKPDTYYKLIDGEAVEVTEV